MIIPPSRFQELSEFSSRHRGAGELIFLSRESISELSAVQQQWTSFQNMLRNRDLSEWAGIQTLESFWGPAAFCHALHGNTRCCVLQCMCVCSCTACWGTTYEKPFSFHSSCAYKQWRSLEASGYWTQRSLRGKSMNIFLHHELDVSMPSFSSTTLLISVVQDQILYTHLLEKMAKDSQRCTYFSHRKHCSGAKGNKWEGLMLKA